MADSDIELRNGNNVGRVQLEFKFQSLNINGERTSSFPTWLEHIESPFNWLPLRCLTIPSKEFITKVKEQIEMDEEFDFSFPFEKFMDLLTLVYELSHQQGDEEEKEVKRHLESCDQLIRDQKKKQKKYYEQLIMALTHSLQGTKAHLLYKENKIVQATELAESLVSVGSLTNHGKAAIEAMKSRFHYHYGDSEAKMAVQCAQRATELAPDEPLWMVLLAESLRRLRKFSPMTDSVSPEEIRRLEKAVSQQRSSRHLILLARAYRETAEAKFKEYRNRPNFFQSQTFFDISDLQSKAFKLYKEALDLKPDYEVVNRLCGYGLLKLPAFTSDYRLAERCLQRALDLSPNNSTTIHSLGLYYYKGLMEYEKAALFCEKAGKLGSFPASLDMLRMKHLVYGETYDPVFDFDKLLKQYGDDRTKKHEILCQMGSYYLFFKRDLPKAMEYFQILVEEKGEPSIMRNHKCTFLNMAHKINLFQCIVNEATLLLQDEDKLKTEAEKHKSIEIRKFLDELKTTDKELFDTPINTKMIDDLHKVSNEIKQTYIRKKERRDSCKEKRRNSLARRRCSLDANLTLTRRHSDGMWNVRRSSSGSIGDTVNSRISKSHSSYKQKFIGSIPFSESADEEKEKPNMARRHSDFDGPYVTRKDSSSDELVRKPVKRVSWGRISSINPPKIENWRRKDST